MLFHWGMAGLVLIMVTLGWYAEDMPLSPAKLQLFFWHKSIGLLILLLTLVRLAWRWRGPVPPPPPEMSRLETQAARLSHGLLYMLLITMPLSGWVINSAANVPLRVFGLFVLPPLVAPDEALKEVAAQMHGIMVWTLVAVVSVHSGAALWHHYVRGDGVLRRMLPQRWSRIR